MLCECRIRTWLIKDGNDIKATGKLGKWNGVSPGFGDFMFVFGMLYHRVE